MANYEEQSDLVVNSILDRAQTADQLRLITEGLIEAARLAITDAISQLAALDINFDEAALAAILGVPPAFTGTKPTPVSRQDLNWTPEAYTPPSPPT